MTFTHRLRFTVNVFNPANPILADLIPTEPNSTPRTITFIDSNVDAAFPNMQSQIANYITTNIPHITTSTTHTIPGGESCKNDRNIFDNICQSIALANLCRRSYVIAIGGGALLDAVGFAASVAHRGIRLIRIPTTTLAQDDSGLAVKNAINAFDQKNYLGTFTVPWAVINDSQFLTTLTDHHWISGFSEAVKVALLKDASFFDQIERDAEKIRSRDLTVALPVIEQSARLHLAHITDCGDPFELTTARPLDLGHWAAHKLEQLSNYSLTHGHAVAIGLAIDITYANRANILPNEPYNRIIACLKSLGFELNHPALADHKSLTQGLEQFREHLGGQLTIPLIKNIADPIDIHEVDTILMQQAIASLAHRR